MTEFIDRAKLEALAEERYPESDLKVFFVEQFMAGAAAYAALLDAETTEEWGVQDQGGGFLISYDEEGQARTLVVRRGQQTVIREVVSRRVLYGPWISSKQGEQS